SRERNMPPSSCWTRKSLERPIVWRPPKELKKAGIKPRGRMAYELADGRTVAHDFGLVEIEFMGELTSGRVIFGPDNAEPLLGVTALESVGILVDPTTRTLKRMPAVPLKQASCTAG